MYKSILVPALIPVCDPDTLDLATQVARLGDGRIEYLYVHPDARELARYTSSLDFESGMFTQQIWDTLVEADKICLARARKAFDAFCACEKLTSEGAVSAAFRETEGNPGERAIAEARFGDLVVIGRPPAPEDLTTGEAGDVLIASGRPVLLTASGECHNPLTTVVIAWKESAASVHAVEAAMPLLKKAQQIHVLGVVEGDGDEAPVRRSAERLAETLKRHGLKPRASHVRAGTRDACEVLLETASQKLEAGVLVMGGYGHSRAREFVFGGFTRHVLGTAPLPVLLAH